MLHILVLLLVSVITVHCWRLLLLRKSLHVSCFRLLLRRSLRWLLSRRLHFQIFQSLLVILIPLLVSIMLRGLRSLLLLLLLLRSGSLLLCS
jgi:hypothetical protein